MGDELKLGLYVIGLLLIGGIFAHGLWSIRKNKEQLGDYKKPPRAEPDLGSKAAAEEPFDDHGVGKPRTIGASRVDTERAEPVIGGVNTDEPSIVEEPSISHFDEVDPVDDIKPAAKPTANTASSDAQSEVEAPEPSEVLIIHISMPESQTISGASLLPQLISMGFKFGEMDIFHRHEDAAGNGAKLFSLASMYNPGTFDIDHIEQLSVRGLSLFMTLPCRGEALQTFNMMHNAAKKLAEHFGAQLLDNQRSALTIQTVRHYVEKIREFERQQLING